MKCRTFAAEVIFQASYMRRRNNVAVTHRYGGRDMDRQIHVTLLQFTKHSGTFLLLLCLETASESAVFGGPVGGLD